MISFNKQTNTGFAMLFSVLMVSLMLTIAIGISSITYKQNLLSGLAKDSQIAFYQADAAVECGKYYDTYLGLFPQGSGNNTYNVDDGVPPAPGEVPDTIHCGNQTLDIDFTQSDLDKITYVFSTNSNTPCFKVTFDKTTTMRNPKTGQMMPVYRVQGSGYNVCSSGNPRQVERSFEFIY